MFPGAAPITLIDGDRLIELAVKHQIGVRRKPVELIEVDDPFFVRQPDEEDVEAVPATET